MVKRPYVAGAESLFLLSYVIHFVFLIVLLRFQFPIGEYGIGSICITT